MALADQSPGLDPTEAAQLVFRSLRTSREGLSSREAERRLVQYGPNELKRRGGRRWPRELARQLTHPLALLLWLAALLSFLVGSVTVCIATLTTGAPFVSRSPRTAPAASKRSPSCT